MGGWKRGADTDPDAARWGNLFFLIFLCITIWGAKAFPLWWLFSLFMTPFLGVFFLMNISYGLPKTLAYIFDRIFKKSGLPKLLKSYLAWIDRQIKKLIKSFKR